MDQEIKKDAGKNRLDLIPVECIDAIGKVLTFGAEKYHDHSWREGINYSRVYGAAQRHLQAFWGEDLDIDEESKLSHLSHAFCNIAFLLTYEANKKRYRTFDDRAGSHNEFYKQREQIIDNIINLVQDNPKFFECGIGEDKLEKVYDTLDYAIHSPYTTINDDDEELIPLQKRQDSPDYPDLTKMTHPEACEHLKVGMRVKILRKAADHSRDWENSWSKYMTKAIGNTYTIGEIYRFGIMFKEISFSYPAFVLEIVGDGE